MAEDYVPGAGTSSPTDTLLQFLPSTADLLSSWVNESGQNRAGKTYNLWNTDSYVRANAFPSWFSQKLSAADLAAQISKLGYTDVVRLKQRLANAGFYEGKVAKIVQSETGKPTDLVDTWSALDNPQIGINSGTWREIDKQALIDALNQFESAGNNNPNFTFDEFLVNQTANYKGQIEGTLKGTQGFQTLASTIEKLGPKYLGRELKDDEIRGLLSAVYSLGSTSSNQSFSAFGVNQPVAGTSAGREVVIGSGPDSSALGIAKSLASAYQLQVTKGWSRNVQSEGLAENERDAFSKGLGFVVGGGWGSLKRFKDWADSQKDTTNPLFDTVREVKDSSGNLVSLVLTFKEGAQTPYFLPSTPSIAQELDNFLNGVKHPGGVEGYNWIDDGSGKMGAYWIPQETFNMYADQMGINKDDHSVEAQDRVARKWATDLLNKYDNNWEDVAFAMIGSEAKADLRRQERATGVSTSFDSDPELNVARYAIEQMAKGYTPSSLSNLYGGKLNPNANIFANTLDFTDPYSGVPTNMEDAAAKADRIFRRAKATEINTAEILDAVVKKIGTDAFANGAPWRNNEWWKG